MEVSDPPRKNKILEFAENHPYVLVAVIGVLVVLLVIMFMNSMGWGVPGMRIKKCGNGKKKEPLNDEEELDELINLIHSKQRKKKQ